jgi:Transglutaminase-like superfamily
VRAAISTETVGRGLSPREKLGLATEIVGAYARARWWLWRTDLPTTLSSLRATSPDPRQRAADPARTGVRLGRAVGRTLRHLPFDSRCLMRSLVLTSVLARRGIESSLVIEVQSEPRFAAHALVEHRGVPLLPPAGPGFRRLLVI